MSNFLGNFRPEVKYEFSREWEIFRRDRSSRVKWNINRTLIRARYVKVDSKVFYEVWMHIHDGEYPIVRANWIDRNVVKYSFEKESFYLSRILESESILIYSLEKYVLSRNEVEHLSIYYLNDFISRITLRCVIVETRRTSLRCMYQSLRKVFLKSNR